MADATALLLRNGTALIFSPNHKTAADAIHAATQKTKNRSHDHRGNETVQPVQQPAMTGNDVTGVLDAEMPLYGGFKQIPQMRDNGERRTQQQQHPGSAEAACGKPGGDGNACYKAAESASPGLVGTDPWPEFRSADTASGEIAADVGHPDHEQDQHQRREALDRIKPHQDRGEFSGRCIAKSRHDPDVP